MLTNFHWLHEDIELAVRSRPYAELGVKDHAGVADCGAVSRKILR